MDELRSADQAAAELGIHPSRVRRMAALHGIGRKLTERAWVFSKEDVETLRSHSNGPGLAGWPKGKKRKEPPAPASDRPRTEESK